MLRLSCLQTIAHRALRPIGSYLVLLLLAVAGMSFDSALAQAPQDTHLYFFTNDGCAPCRQVEPAIEGLKLEGYPVTTLKLNDHVRFAGQFEVDRTPTVVMVSGGKMVGRHLGLIDGVTLKKWFAAVGMPNGSTFADSATSPEEPVSTKIVIDREHDQLRVDPARVPENYSTPTMRQGTAKPRNVAEERAMRATVRLKVEDTQGISYATGTVVHTHGNESLVMTCGHVFRANRGQGVITAEYNFYTDPARASGRLIHYDAGPRDIALVAIKTQQPITPVALANVDARVSPGRDIFSIGCDRGNDPTIRHSRIKNIATYDGSIKYDIYGRPVDGRSGGGLFTNDGKLIGICNAFAVESDEGIYTALETIHWELANTGLEHLFENQREFTYTSQDKPNRPNLPERSADSRYADPSFPGTPNGRRSTDGTANISRPMVKIPATNRARSFPTPDGPVLRPANEEVVILVRSKTNPQQQQRIAIKNPTPELLDYLKKMR